MPAYPFVLLYCTKLFNWVSLIVLRHSKEHRPLLASIHATMRYQIQFPSKRRELPRSPQQPRRLMKICIKAKRWSEMGDSSQIKDPFTKNKRAPEKQRDVRRGRNKTKQRQELEACKGDACINQFGFFLSTLIQHNTRHKPDKY